MIARGGNGGGGGVGTVINNYHTNNISTLDAKSLRHAFRYGDLGREMQRMGAR